MSCYLYKVGFAETALIFSAATLVGASLIQSWFGGGDAGFLLEEHSAAWAGSRLASPLLCSSHGVRSSWRVIRLSVAFS